MTPVEFGFTMPQLPKDQSQRGGFVEDVNRALTLITGHFDSARIIDHIGVDDIESFSALAYFAALHPRIKFGHMVICQSFRNPALVAKMGATLQFLTGGRFLLGIGAGWNEEEYRAYGYDFPLSRVRVAQLDEAIQIIKGMWEQETFTFLGEHYRVVDAACEPKPNPVPPIMVGAFKPKTMRITAQCADEWNVSSTGINAYRRLVTEFDGVCEAVGRDPLTVRRSWGGGCVCMPTQAEVRRVAGDRYDQQEDGDFDFVGTPEQLITQMQPFVDVGVSGFMLDCGGFPNLTTLELLVNEVLPALNDRG